MAKINKKLFKDVSKVLGARTAKRKLLTLLKHNTKCQLRDTESLFCLHLGEGLHKGTEWHFWYTVNAKIENRSYLT
mgnify:CR=1 FL=1